MLYYIIISIVTFVIWGVDKFKAVNQQWRVPEKVLFGLIVLGGGVGALLGMEIFRHKTRKPQFWVAAVLGVLVHVAIYLFVIRGS